jgi:hypothetical protein
MGKHYKKRSNNKCSNKKRSNNKRSNKKCSNNKHRVTYKRPIYGGNDFGEESWKPSFFNGNIMYPVNNYNNDPSWINNGNLSARNINLGGSKKRRKLSKKNGSKKGGYNEFGANAPIGSSPIFTFGNTSNAPISHGLLSGNGIPLNGNPTFNNNSIKPMM